MKKQLLFLLALVAALCVNAQVTWNSVDLALGADESAFKGIENGGPESAELEDLTIIFEGQTDWLFKAVEGDVVTFDYNGNTYNQTQVQGATNGMEGFLMHSTGPSCALHFVPAVSGTLDIAFKFGYNKKFFVAALTEDDLDEADFSTDMKAYAYDTTKYWGHFIDANTYEYYIPEVGEDGKAIPHEDNPDNPHFTGATINLEAGKEYYAWFAGSKIMFCGLVFTAEEDPGVGVGVDKMDNNATIVNTEYYNIMGVKLAEPAKGVNIIRHNMSDGSVKISKGTFLK
jgi:hypothetical protein